MFEQQSPLDFFSLFVLNFVSWRLLVAKTIFFKLQKYFEAESDLIKITVKWRYKYQASLSFSNGRNMSGGCPKVGLKSDFRMAS